MKDFNNILYVSHGKSDETEGLQQAMSLARNNGAQLKVLVIGPSFSGQLADYKQKLESALIDQTRESVRKTASQLKIQGEDTGISVVFIGEDQSSIGIVKQVLRGGHDLLVKETEANARDGGFKAMDMSLLRKCPCPVWLCRPINGPRQDIRIGVAVDPITQEAAAYDLSRRLLQLSGSLAAECSGELNVIACWSFEHEGFMRHNPWIKSNEDAVMDAVSQAQNDHRLALDELLDDSTIGATYNVHHVRGDPESKIPEFVSEQQIDVLVMGTVARVGIPGFIFGNTAENVLQELTCSVMAMKPQGFVSPVKAYD